MRKCRSFFRRSPLSRFRSWCGKAFVLAIGVLGAGQTNPPPVLRDSAYGGGIRRGGGTGVRRSSVPGVPPPVYERESIAGRPAVPPLSDEGVSIKDDEGIDLVVLDGDALEGIDLLEAEAPLTSADLDAYVVSGAFAGRVATCEFPLLSGDFHDDCVQLWNATTSSEESSSEVFFTARNSAGDEQEFSVIPPAPPTTTARPSASAVAGAQSSFTSATTDGSNEKQKIPGPVIPSSLLRHVPGCFDWGIAGDAWMEYGERELAWRFLRKSGAAVLELGAGSGSVSVVIQRAMRARERARVRDHVRLLNERRAFVLQQEHGGRDRRGKTRRPAVWGAYHADVSDEVVLADITEADYLSAFAHLKQLIFPRESMDLREAYHGPQKNVSYDELIGEDILPIWQRHPWYIDRFLDLVRRFEKSAESASGGGRRGASESTGEQQDGGRLLDHGSPRPADAELPDYAEEEQGDFTTVVLPFLQGLVVDKYYTTGHGAGFYPYGRGLRHRLEGENAARVERLWAERPWESEDSSRSVAHDRDHVAFRSGDPGALVSRIVALLPDLLFRHVFDFMEVANHIAVQPLMRATAHANYMMTGVSLSALEANRDRCFPNPWSTLAQTVGDVVSSSDDAVEESSTPSSEEETTSPARTGSPRTEDGLAFDPLILSGAFQIVNHALARREAEVWIQVP